LDFKEGPSGIRIEGDSDIIPNISGIASSTSLKAWKVQGIKMMKHRFYSQAVKCFNNSGDAHLEQRASAYMMANDASKMIVEADTLIE
jgi:hypothetical protein